MTTYLLAGGGTAGHVNPMLAVADRLREREPTSKVLVLGTSGGLEARLVPERGYELLEIARVAFPRHLNKAALRFPRELRAATRRVRDLIIERDVDVVVGFGGYVSAPAYLAARSEHVLLVIHEANAKPGLANRLGALITRYVGVAFPGTRLRGALAVGMPLRSEIESLDRFSARSDAIAEFGLDAHRPTLVVTGGSSGAQRLNETITESVTLLLGTGWQVVHLTGAYRDRVADPGLPGYVVLDYTDRMELLLAIADLAITRAGTSTVAELAALGVPAVFVPYPVGNGEQRYNAREALDAGGAILVEDSHFDADWVGSTLVPLLRDRARIAQMAARMADIGHLDATDRMVDLIQRSLSQAAAPAPG